MKVVYVANIRFPTEKAHGFQIAKMCEALGRAGADVELMHPRRRQPDPSISGKDCFDYYGVERVFSVRSLPNVDVLRLEPFVPRLAVQGLVAGQALAWGRFAAGRAGRSKADLYCTRDSAVAYWLTGLGLPTLLELHGWPGVLQSRLTSRCAQRPSLRALVVLTRPLREAYERVGAPGGRIRVMADAVDLRLFNQLPDPAACRARLGLPQDRPIVGYVGGFKMMGAGKGIPDLIRAFAGIQGSTAPVLVCVGGPLDAVPPLRETARQCGLTEDRIRFVDRVPNSQVPTWMRALDIGTVPSPNLRHYSLCASPLKVFEYMAAETPILATDLPALHDVLDHGRTAWLVPPDNPDALRQGLCRLLDDAELRASLAREARRHVEGLTWDRRAEGFLEFARSSSVGNRKS